MEHQNQLINKLEGGHDHEGAGAGSDSEGDAAAKAKDPSFVESSQNGNKWKMTTLGCNISVDKVDVSERKTVLKLVTHVNRGRLADSLSVDTTMII